MKTLPTDMSEWAYYPIEMPIDKDGNAPATIGEECIAMQYQVWDRAGIAYGTYYLLPDAVNKAMQLSLAKLNKDIALYVELKIQLHNCVEKTGVDTIKRRIENFLFEAIETDSNDDIQVDISDSV